MTRQITYGIVADGGTDRVLESIITWTIRRLDPEVEIIEPEFMKRQGSLADGLTQYLEQYPQGPMLVFAHRDAENAAYEVRLAEFNGLEDERVVPVIPVRMTEAWLLIDPTAIAHAVGVPRAKVTVPRPGELEALSDPKSVLEGLLIEAAGDPTGRRRKYLLRKLTTFRVGVASRIEDFSTLEQLPSYIRFREALTAAYPYGQR